MKNWLLLTSLFFAFAVRAQDREPASLKTDGQRKAAMCAACHGEKGVSINPLWPNLAGQKKEYLKLQLTAFRDGHRVNELMSPVSKTLSDADIASLAEYFSSL